MGLIESIVSGILSRIAYDEATASLPAFTRLLLETAARFMVPSERTEARAEWNAWIDQTPGKYSKAIVASGFMAAALKARMALVAPALKVATSNLWIERAFFAGYCAGYMAAALGTEKWVFDLAYSVSSEVPVRDLLRLRVVKVANVLAGRDKHHSAGDLAVRLLGMKCDGALKLVHEQQES